MIETKPRIATVDSCFELVGSRQHGAATTAKSRTSDGRELDGLLNARGRDFGWAQTQTSVHVIARESATNNEQRTEISCRCRLK